MTNPNDKRNSNDMRDIIQPSREYDPGEIDSSNDRVIMTRPDEDSAEAAFAFAGGDDFSIFRCDRFHPHRSIVHGEDRSAVPDFVCWFRAGGVRSKSQCSYRECG